FRKRPHASRAARWQVFGLAGTAPWLAPPTDRRFPGLDGPVLLAPRACARHGRLSFPFTAAGQSRNRAGFPVASADLDGLRNQLRAAPYLAALTFPSTTC